MAGAACCSTGSTFPVRLYLYLFFCVIPSCISISFIFPFISFFVLHLELADEKGKVGRIVGLIVSMYFLGRAGGSLIWGNFADRYGRKLTLIICTICSGVCMCGFGFSTTLFELCTWRLLAGLTNGILTAVKTMANEIATNPEDRNKGQAWTESGWSVGLMIGPAIGGWLSTPCGTDTEDPLWSGTWAAFFGFGKLDGIFCKHPFLLPCVWGTVLHLLVLPCSFALPETSASTRGYSSKLGSTEQERIEDHETEPEGITASVIGSVSNGGVCCQADGTAEDFVDVDVALDASEIVSENAVLQVKVTNDASAKANSASQGRCLPRWCGRDLTLIVFARAVAVMSYVMWNEVLSIWCMTPQFRGGLQWSARSIGKVWGAAGFFMCGLQLWLMPVLMNSVGTWRAVVLGAFFNVPTLAALPWIATLQSLPDEEDMRTTIEAAIAYAEANTLLPTALPFVVMFCLMSLVNVFVQMFIIGTSVFIGNSVTREFRARANSLGIGVQSLFMAFAPSLGGLLFAWSLERTPYHASTLDAIFEWPLGCHPVFLLCAALLVPVGCTALCISRSLERSPEDLIPVVQEKT